MENLKLCLDNYGQMESNLGLMVSGTNPGERLRKVLKLRLEKVRENPEKFLWNTVWIIAQKEENRKIGTIMLKG